MSSTNITEDDAPEIGDGEGDSSSKEEDQKPAAVENMEISGEEEAGKPEEEEALLVEPRKEPAAPATPVPAAVSLQEKWDEMFARLARFKEKNGHCLVPNRFKEDPSLGSWVATQRRTYKILSSGGGASSGMNAERAQRLMDLGFEWSTSDPRHVPWEERYEELKAFVAANGHAEVPMRWEENVQLSNWVSKQRQDYKLVQLGKTTRLTNKRKRLLNDIGFMWEIPRKGRRQRKSKPLQQGDGASAAGSEAGDSLDPASLLDAIVDTDVSTDFPNKEGQGTPGALPSLTAAAPVATADVNPPPTATTNPATVQSPVPPPAAPMAVTQSQPPSGPAPSLAQALNSVLGSLAQPAGGNTAMQQGSLGAGLVPGLVPGNALVNSLLVALQNLPQQQQLITQQPPLPFQQQQQQLLQPHPAIGVLQPPAPSQQVQAAQMLLKNGLIGALQQPQNQQQRPQMAGGATLGQPTFQQQPPQVAQPVMGGTNAVQRQPQQPQVSQPMASGLNVQQPAVQQQPQVSTAVAGGMQAPQQQQPSQTADVPQSQPSMQQPLTPTSAAPGYASQTNPASQVLFQAPQPLQHSMGSAVASQAQQPNATLIPQLLSALPTQAGVLQPALPMQPALLVLPVPVATLLNRELQQQQQQTQQAALQGATQLLQGLIQQQIHQSLLSSQAIIAPPLVVNGGAELANVLSSLAVNPQALASSGLTGLMQPQPQPSSVQQQQLFPPTPAQPQQQVFTPSAAPSMVPTSAQATPSLQQQIQEHIQQHSGPQSVQVQAPVVHHKHETAGIEQPDSTAAPMAGLVGTEPTSAAGSAVSEPVAAPAENDDTEEEAEADDSHRAAV